VLASKTAAKVILRITTRDLKLKRTLLLYRFLQLVLLPFLSLYFLARLLRRRAYRPHFRERLGLLPKSINPTNSASIWLHAVSVGEVTSVVPLLRELKKSDPLVPLFLSTSTVAGRNAALRQAVDLTAGIFYCPLDFASCVRRVICRVRPALLIVVETEIWPNLYTEIRRSGARLAIVNGRISERAFGRYRKWKRHFGPVLRLPDLIFVQSEADLERYAELGAPRNRLAIAANLKYDAAAAGTSVPLESFGARHIWIAASTVGPNERGSLAKHAVDEDDLVLDAFEALAREFPDLLLVLAPRQPDRFEPVARKLEARKLNFGRRTAMLCGESSHLELPGVLLLDTVGELAGFYHLADAVFVGGSIAPRGGHNILEPAAARAPIVVGPHMQNFEAIARDFLNADALVQIRSADEFLPAIRRLLLDRDSARELGLRAQHLLEARRGAARQLSERLRPLFYAASLRQTRHWLARLFLAPLAGLWREGGTLKRKHLEHFTLIAPPLSAPVISIGGLTIGGSGKTPFAVYLVNRLRARGFQPAILTRGYRRRYPAEALVIAAGAKIPTAFTGDEAQIFLRAGDAPVGIGSNRYETAQILLRQFPSTDVLVLDDGFQHARLMRDIDIVMIDGLDPFGGEQVVPLGRLREPLSALARADIFVVSRVEKDLQFQAIARRLANWNPAAPVFRARLAARSWHDYRTGAIIAAMPGRRAAAFCGLGNPESFWRTLESQGIEVVFRWAFADHHAYNPVELQRVAHQARLHGAEFLVTTEKDRINCPKYLERAIAPLELIWLKIEYELENEAGFFAALEEKLAAARVPRVSKSTRKAQLSPARPPRR